MDKITVKEEHYYFPVDFAIKEQIIVDLTADSENEDEQGNILKHKMHRTCTKPERPESMIPRRIAPVHHGYKCLICPERFKEVHILEHHMTEVHKYNLAAADRQILWQALKDPYKTRMKKKTGPVLPEPSKYGGFKLLENMRETRPELLICNDGQDKNEEKSESCGQNIVQHIKVNTEIESHETLDPYKGTILISDVTGERRLMIEPDFYKSLVNQLKPPGSDIQSKQSIEILEARSQERW